jgi:hypothetical protein
MESQRQEREFPYNKDGGVNNLDCIFVIVDLKWRSEKKLHPGITYSFKVGKVIFQNNSKYKQNNEEIIINRYILRN